MKKLIVLLLVGLTLVGCGTKPAPEKELEKLVIGGTSLPHAEFLRQLKDPLKELGYDLEVKEFDDYVLPNEALDNGNLDANFFQHIPYLEDFNETKGTKLSPLLKVHYEPIALYGGLKDSLETVAANDTVLVPDDATNLPRALKLLESFGWIELNDNKDTATLKDIVKNIKEIKIELVSAENIAKLLDNAEYGVVNANYALTSNITERGIKAETVTEDVIKDIVNVVAVRTGEENSEKSKAILKAFEDPKVVEYIKTKYTPAVISVLGE
ncbi:MAG: metal ABC transporter substrate-binding protein [Erysipelothrix sp.]|nr:metal ABC transporter substrate-binding protein [Erysipelothrix sp.]